jgi:hypothetical protein
MGIKKSFKNGFCQNKLWSARACPAALRGGRLPDKSRLLLFDDRDNQLKGWTNRLIRGDNKPPELSAYIPDQIKKYALNMPKKALSLMPFAHRRTVATLRAIFTMCHP